MKGAFIVHGFEGIPKIPDLDIPVFAPSHQPFTVAMKGYRRDIVGVAFKRDVLRYNLLSPSMEGRIDARVP
jgi:hypothetical protein